MSFSLVYITYPDQQSADQIIHTLLEEKLIAGANKMPIESAYWWQAAIQQEGEIVSIMQTQTILVDQIKARVGALHPYEVPCIIHWEVNANNSYEAWVQEETTRK